MKRAAWFPARVSRMVDGSVLKAVSRSFYLSLRLLPAPMRPGASLGYLLARASDTIADIPAPAEVRLETLDGFAEAVARGGGAEFPEALPGMVAHPGERHLLSIMPRVLGALGGLPEEQAGLVREVVATIVSGQRLDILRFGGVPPGGCAALADETELDDYTWRVAGCVGAFWTDLGFLTMGGAFSRASPAVLRERGIAFGKGLQLVNILRDMPADAALGRCYLPVADPADPAARMVWRDRLVPLAEERMGEGLEYARALGTRRLRISAALPAMLGNETLRLLRAASWDDLARGVKVPRRRVYQLLGLALAGRFR